MSYSMLAQSQRFFIASKPTRPSLIFKFLTEFPDRCLQDMNDSPVICPFHNVTIVITLRFTVTSVTSSPPGFPLFYWKKIQDFSRTFQDPHKNFSRTFTEPTNTWISRKMRKNNHLLTLFEGMVHCSKQKLYTAWSTQLLTLALQSQSDIERTYLHSRYYTYLQCLYIRSHSLQVFQF